MEEKPIPMEHLPEAGKRPFFHFTVILCPGYGEMMKKSQAIGRRAFLRGGTLILGAGIASGSRTMSLLAAERQTKQLPTLSIGLLTDIHYADRDTRINRFYRESHAKMRECIDRFNELKPD